MTGMMTIFLYFPASLDDPDDNVTFVIDQSTNEVRAQVNISKLATCMINVLK